MKRYMNCALLYSVLAMAGGVFFRETLPGKQKIPPAHSGPEGFFL